MISYPIITFDGWQLKFMVIEEEEEEEEEKEEEEEEREREARYQYQISNRVFHFSSFPVPVHFLLFSLSFLSSSFPTYS
jgi:CO dehydrogenase/acetyl-CoA synthase beta subunit